MTAAVATTKRTSVRARGYTIVEFLVVLVLSSVLLGGALLLYTQLVTHKRQVGERSSSVSNALEAYGALQRDLARAGRGLFSTHNWSGIGVGIDASDVSDTLTIFWADGPAYRASVAPCDNEEPSCVRLLHPPNDAFTVGDLLVIGSPGTGARVVQVTDISASYNASCDGDCDAPGLSCSDVVGATIMAPVVVGSLTHGLSGDTIISDLPCLQSYFLDGRWCEEVIDVRAVGVETASFCAVESGPTERYVDVGYADRTLTPFGFPGSPTFTPLSGAAAYPQIVAQPVAFARYYIQSSAQGPTLVRQSALRSDGVFQPSAIVAPGISTLRVYTQHADTSQFVRGVGVTGADLALDPQNPNLIEHGAPEPDRLVRAYSYRRSWRTIGAVSARFTVLDQALEGEVETGWTASAATGALLDGGVLDLYRPAQP